MTRIIDRAICTYNYRVPPKIKCIMRMRITETLDKGKLRHTKNTLGDHFYLCLYVSPGLVSKFC